MVMVEETLIQNQEVYYRTSQRAFLNYAIMGLKTIQTFSLRSNIKTIISQSSATFGILVKKLNQIS